jgi:hypothetical protein
MNLHRILFLVVSSVLLGAVAHAEATLIGEWYTRDDRQGIYGRLNFREDGKFDGYVDFRSKRAITFEGTWKLKEKILYYIYSKCEPTMVFPDGKDQDEIVSIHPDYYLFKTAKGELHRYDRFIPGKATPPNQLSNP